MSTELQQLRQKLRVICPGNEAQILKMSKQDLIDLLKLSENKQNDNSSHKDKKTQTKKEMSIREKIKSFYPQVQKQLELDLLQQDQLKQIYESAMQNFQVKAAPSKQQVGAVVKRQQKKKKTFNSNGLVNSNQMKKALIQKLPEYRNQITNMSELEMQKMYNKMVNKHQDTVFNPKNSTKVEFEIPKTNKPQPERPSYMNYYSSTENHIARRFQTVNNQLNNSSFNKYKEADLISIDDNDQGLNTQFQNEERRRGRPRKLKEDIGINYDNAPNYDPEPRRNTYNNMYQPSNYVSDASHIYENNINLSESQFNYAKTSRNPYDEPLTLQKVSKPLNLSVNKQILPLNENRSDGKVQLMQKQQAKLMKRKYKCKITFYLNQSDLEEEAQKDQKDQKQESKQNNEERKQNGNGNEDEAEVNKAKKTQPNALAKIISSLQESFKNKAWKIE